MRFLLNIITLLLLLSCGSTSESYKSAWHEKSSKAPAAVFHKDNELTLAVSNDNSFLYIEIASTSTKTIQQIQELGLSLWISEGKFQKEQHGIHYPLPYENSKGKVALEGFSKASLTALSIEELAPIQIKTSLPAKNAMQYELKIPLSELAIENLDFFTISLASFTRGKEEYLNSLTTAEEIERRLDAYKANPQNTQSRNELIPFFKTFQLAKKPNRNP